jgi:peptidoglycan/LPS O-acetylase OafA/YrhL
MALGIALTLLAATASWWLVERPVARWRARRATA